MRLLLLLPQPTSAICKLTMTMNTRLQIHFVTLLLSFGLTVTSASTVCAEECNCAFTAVLSMFDDATAEYSTQVEAPSCGVSFWVRAFPLFACVGFTQEQAMTELLQHRFVSNLGCDDRVRELEFPFIHTCDHLKDISSTLHIHIDYGPENDGSGGTVTAWVDSLHWVAELGFTSAGKSAGRLRLEADILSRELLSPKSLFLEGTGVRDFVPRSPNTPDIPRQLLCPETFIDIVQESVDAYRLDFYRADEVVGTTDKVFYYDRDYHHWMELTGASPTWSDSVGRWNLATNYIYCVAEGAVPFVRYRIENPDYTESVTRLRITTERPGIPSSYIEYSRPGEGVW